MTGVQTCALPIFGFMSFFVKASVMALQEFSAVNAEIRDENIIYKNHFDIGIAVGTEKGLVVPVLKNADKMTFGDIEKQIIELSTKAKEGTLTMDDLSGGLLPSLMAGFTDPCLVLL